MKVLCEVPLDVSTHEESQFIWLTSNDVNGLFIVESGKRLRVLSIKQEPAEEIQSAALAETRVCTHFSWNKGTNLLAIVVDKRQIYFWEVKTNTFTHFKSQFGQLSSSNASSARKSRSRDIELVAWSKLTDKLAICYATGQILLCRFVKTANVSEKFIDNSESVLKRIVSIEVCEHADLFACFSVISEVLVMTFDGQTKFYVQGDGLNLFNAKFSNPIHEINAKRMANLTTTTRQKTIWLAYQSKSDGLFFKKISWDNNDFQDIKPKLDILHDKDSDESRLINFFWLTSTRLIACFSSGTIFIAQLSTPPKHQLDSASIGQIWCDEVFKIRASDNPLAETVAGDEQSFEVVNGSMDSSAQTFKTFGLVRCKEGGQVQPTNSKRHCFALVAATDYKVFYYELHERDQQAPGDVGPNRRDQQQHPHHQQTAISFEQVDEVDLLSSLRKLNLKIERASWCHDASMLAVQLTSGHILIYRTRLQFQTVASYGPRTAYLSSLNEITILNYGLASEQQQQQPKLASDNSVDSSNQLESGNENAVILHVGLRPSIIAIGPKHLALALNNRVRFYLISNNNKPTNKVGQHQTNLATHFDEQEYATIVIGLKLNSKFAVIQFDDGRLKLQSINQQLIPGYERHKEEDTVMNSTASNNDDDDEEEDERFFPDPARPENICTFTLTELLLVYCSRECNISIFSLKDWLLVQTCNHPTLFRWPIRKLVANDVGNKFVCLLEDQQSSDGPIEQRQYMADDRNIYLYDLYSNQVTPLGNNEPLLERIFEHQIDETLQLMWMSCLAAKSVNHRQKVRANNMRMPRQVLDAIWDTDGRTLLLVERESVHVVAVLDHTLDREEPIVEYADSSSKPTSYTILYASQGIVSYQTSLGRVINAILETHDDEMKLTRLELQISFVVKDTTSHVGVGRQSDAVADIPTPSVVDDNQRLERMRILLGAQLDIMYLKLSYLRTILPIYSLPKCYDICEHLMSDEQFNLVMVEEDAALIGSDSDDQRDFQSDSRLINQLLWKQLAAWSIHCLNLDFALLIYRKHNLLTHSRLLAGILDDLRLEGLDSRQAIRSRLLILLLGCCDDKNDDNK